MREPLPLAQIQDAVLDFLRNRPDVVLFGAQAVNAYVDEPRMTQDVDILCVRAEEFSEEIRQHLAAKFHIAVRVRIVADGKGYRVYQMREPKNRHLADVRKVETLPPTQLIGDVLVPLPEELIAQKVISYVGRRGQPKSDTDLRDIKLLLLTYPSLMQESGLVRDRLIAATSTAAVLDQWRDFANMQLSAESDDAGY